MKDSIEVLEKYGNVSGSYVEDDGKVYYQGIATFNYKVCVLLEKITKDNGFVNRKTSTVHKNKLLEDMKKEKWVLTGQPVILDCNGSIIDGGHRVSAVTSDKTKSSSFKSFFVIGVGTENFNNIDSGRARTASQLVEIALQGKDITTKGLTIHSMVKADRALSDYLECKEKRVVDFYDKNRKSDPLSRPERVNSLVSNPRLKVAFEKVQQNLEVENLIRKDNAVKPLRLSANTRIAMAVLGSLEDEQSFAAFISTVMSYKNQEEHYTVIKEEDLPIVYVGKAKANKLSVMVVYVIHLYRKYLNQLPPSKLKPKPLTDPTSRLL